MYGPIEHARTVQAIAARVRSFYDGKTQFRVYHGHTNSTRSVHRSADNIVDTSSLNHVLRVNLQAKTVQVEPNVCMEHLLDATLERGLVPLIVPEFRGITVGGAYAGTAGESSSYKHGLFDSTVVSIEIILADGTLTHASVASNADLLRGGGGACGTLGVVTLLEVQLIEASEYVQITYNPVSSAAESIGLMKRLDPDSSVDYIDGIMFSPTSGVVMAGKLSSEAESRRPSSIGSIKSSAKGADHRHAIQRFTRPWDEHFYTHVEKHLFRNSPTPWTDVIPIRDYIFRYDRGCFWGAERAYSYFHVPFNRVTRWMLDSFMASKVMFHAMHESGLADKAIIQDVAVPIDRTATFIKWQDEELKCYPLWLCPLRASGCEGELGAGGRPFGAGKKAGLGDLFCNVGIWIMAPTMSRDDFVALNRKIEKEVAQLDGLKTLYAHSYYSEDEFWEIYDMDSYQKLRQKYNAQSLMDVWQKVTVKTRQQVTGTSKETMLTRLSRMTKDLLKERWPFRGLYGVWKVLTSREYLIKEKSQ